MRSFEIFVDDEKTLEDEGSPRSSLRKAPLAAARTSRAREVLDVFVHGANVTATIAETRASCVLRDLALAVSELEQVARGKRIVHFYDDAWELALERDHHHAFVSLYRGGAIPEVLLYDAPGPFADVRAGVESAVTRVLARPGAGAAELEDVRGAFGGGAARGVDGADSASMEGDRPASASMPALVEIDRGAPIAFGCDFAMRPGPDATTAELTERSDLHALLFRGRVRAEIRGREVDLGESHPFLVAERLLELSRAAIDAWDRGQAHHARGEVGGVQLGIRTNAGGHAALIVGRLAAPPEERTTRTFPALDVCDVAQAAIAFARSLSRVILRRDRTQHHNLRLGALRQRLRELAEILREAERQDGKINPAPESYRAFALRSRSGAPSSGPELTASRLRYTPRWRALVPGIDLGATFLCGDRIVVGAAGETCGLDRTTGHLAWRIRGPRAASVPTPGGLARIFPDGAIEICDLGTGEVTLRAWIAPRRGAPYSGAVVSSPGLPRLLIVTEGEHHLVAIDLLTGEARWRFSWGKSGPVRLKRAGKLLYVTSGDRSVTALDVVTGAVVWRARERLRLRGAPTVDHDGLFMIAGGTGSPALLLSLDPWSGQPLWKREIGPGAASVEGAPLVSDTSVAVLVRDRAGLVGLKAHDRMTGRELFVAEGVAPSGASWLAVDELFIANTPSGELLGLDRQTGAARWRRALGPIAETDVPRRLEPVLRSGALFVPHVDVQVFRPADGVKLASVSPTDAIPDLLRVDERCDVYVAEESGHMVCFGAGPRLSLVI